MSDFGIAPPGFRLPGATRLGRVSLQVADLARSLAFYEEVLGFRVTASAPGRASLAAGGDDAPLVELHEKPGVRPVPRRGLLGLFHFAILLPDRESLGRLVTHLAEIGAHAGMSDHAVSEALYLSDPDGLGIEVYADRPRATWRREGQQLYMTTQPLDVASLVSAAGATRWSGMPNGTTIGHVHLHVGDLEQAAAFYHTGLGLDKVVWGYPGALFLSAGGYHHHLGTNTWAAGAAPAGAGDARLLEWEIIVPDAAAAAAAASSLAAAGHRADAVGDAWRATDPWGTTLAVRGER